MSEKGFGQSDPEIAKYAIELFRPEDETLARAREYAQAKGLPSIQLGAFDARHLEVLVRLMQAKKAVEIGTLGGYSGISIARGLGAGGKLHTFELDPHHAEVARQMFKEARLSAEVIVYEGPALENLPQITSQAPFDLVFIDADKVSYPKYLAWAIDHLRVGGAIVADNTFAHGQIHRKFDFDPKYEKTVHALREFNQAIAHNPRFRATMIPTAEGLTVAVKIS